MTRPCPFPDKDDPYTHLLLTKQAGCATRIQIVSHGDEVMPISLRIPPDKEELIRRAAQSSGKSKSAFILECVYEKLGLTDRRSQAVRKLAGWMPPSEAEELRQSTEVFNKIQEGDWD